MEGERISYHESVRRVYDRIKADGINNIWDRYEAQGIGGNPTSAVPSVWEVCDVTCVPTGLAGLTSQRTRGVFAVSLAMVWLCV